jgi:hypothetical protein
VSHDSFTPEERALIERLSNAPQPEMKADAFEAIRARMLDAMDTPYPAPDIQPVPRTFPASVPFMLGAVAIVVIAFVAVFIAISNRPSTEEPLAVPSQTSALSITVVPTFTPVILTVTPIPTEIPILVEQTTEPTQTVVPPPVTVVPSDTVVPPTETTAPTDTAVPTATATLETVIVVEGPVQSIDDNIVTIYDIEIILNPEDPLLDFIEIGDVIHVDADFNTDTADVVAVDVEYVDTEANDDVAVNPDTDETWRDDGTCNNPPPSWAPANGWRRRCEGGSAAGNSSNNGDGNNGNGNNGNGNNGGNGGANNAPPGNNGNNGNGNNGNGNNGNNGNGNNGNGNNGNGNNGNGNNGKSG